MGRTGAISYRNVQARQLFAGLPRTYERLGALLSFGQDPRWRRFLVSKVPVPSGGLVLDVATGTAAVARRVAARTGASVVGLDQSEPMVREGLRRVGADGMPERIRFVLGRAERLPFDDETFDALTFTYLFRYVDEPAATLRELTRVIRPGGAVANLEFHVPSNPGWRAMWMLYTRAAMPAVGRLVSKSWYEVGRFLGRSVSDFYLRHPFDEQLGWWRGAGVHDVQARVMSLGGGVVIWGTKRGR